jgi:hypothetical protein
MVGRYVAAKSPAGKMGKVVQFLSSQVKTIMSIVSLSEISYRLGQFYSPPRKAANERLLSLLKSGELKAGFYYLSEQPVWIALASKYWLSVSSDGFLLTDDAEAKTKTIRIGELAGEFLRVLCPNSTAITPATWKEVENALRTASTRYEVVVQENDWSAYLTRNRLEYPPKESRTRVGRPEKPSWRKLAVIMGAYMMERTGYDPEQIKLASEAQEIYERAEKANINDLPSVETISDCLSEIRKEVNKTRGRS